MNGTPGPWAWQDFGQLMLTGQHGLRPIVLQSSPKGLRVRGLDTDWMIAITPDHPDARLIALAPDLLEALRILVEDAEMGVHPAEHLERARALLAKAEGKTRRADPDLTFEEFCDAGGLARGGPHR